MAETFTIAEAMRELGVSSRTTVYNLKRAAGIKMPRPAVTFTRRQIEAMRAKMGARKEEAANT